MYSCNPTEIKEELVNHWPQGGFEIEYPFKFAESQPNFSSINACMSEAIASEDEFPVNNLHFTNYEAASSCSNSSFLDLDEFIESL